MLGAIGQCWSAFYDGLALHSELEVRIRRAILAGEVLQWPSGTSAATRGLAYATSSEVADYFRERRNYVEAVATLDLAICIETAVREDRALRLTGAKSHVSTVGSQIANCPTAPGQTEPAARRLLSYWLAAGTAAGVDFRLLDDALVYRNWLAHGSGGLPPASVVTPFLLDPLVADFMNFVVAEP
jgi:hypothetical protein